MKRRTLLAMAFALALVASYALASLGQQMPDSNRKPPCGCFICGTLDYVLFDDGKDCAGILAQDACPEEMAKMPSEKRAAICQKIKAKLKLTSFKDSCQIFAPFCESQKNEKPKCEPPRAGSNSAPWFSPGDCREKGRIIQNRTSSDDWYPGRPCSIIYWLEGCSETATNIATVLKRTRSESECDAFFDLHDKPEREVCCDKWQQATASGSPCNPMVDADCDGIPNQRDPFPIQPQPREFQNSSGVNDMLPIWKDIADRIPQEPCEGCQWTVGKLDYKCKNVEIHRRESYREAQYEYQARWKCPSTGRELVTSGRMSARGAQCPRQ